MVLDGKYFWVSSVLQVQSLSKHFAVRKFCSRFIHRLLRHAWLPFWCTYSASRIASASKYSNDSTRRQFFLAAAISETEIFSTALRGRQLNAENLTDWYSETATLFALVRLWWWVFWFGARLRTLRLQHFYESTVINLPYVNSVRRNGLKFFRCRRSTERCNCDIKLLCEVEKSQLNISGSNHYRKRSL